MEGVRGHRGTHREPGIVNLAAGDDSDGDTNRVYPAGGNVAGPEFLVIVLPLFVKSVDAAPGLERLREPGFQKLSKLCCMRSTPTEVQSMNENDFECLAKTRVNTRGTMLPSSSLALLLHVTPFIPGANIEHGTSRLCCQADVSEAFSGTTYATRGSFCRSRPWSNLGEGWHGQLTKGGSR